MVKLTADLINGAAQYTNAIRERELDLSGKFSQFLRLRMRCSLLGPAFVVCLSGLFSICELLSDLAD